MGIRDLFKKKPAEPTPEQLQATVPLDNQVVEAPKRYAIQPGEYFPLKGFMFKVVEVNERGFIAIVHGLTKKRKHEAEERKKEAALRQELEKAKSEPIEIPTNPA